MNVRTDLRPSEFGGLVGMTKEMVALRTRCEAGKIPQTILLSGPTGCGKTTTARIIRDMLGTVGGGLTVDERNAASLNGVEEARSIEQQALVRPLSGFRLFILDECQRFSKDAQDVLLKVTEEPPAWCFFVFCTTEPGKISKTLLGRCFQVRVGEVGVPDAQDLVGRVLKYLKAKGNPEQIAKALVSRGITTPRAILDAAEMFVLTGEMKALDAEKAPAFDAVRAYYSGDLATVAAFFSGADTNEIVSWQFTAANYGAATLKRGPNAAAAAKVLNITTGGYPDEAVLRAAWIVARVMGGR